MAEERLPTGSVTDAIFQDPHIRADDPLVKFIKRSWKEVLITALAVAAALYGYQVFHETRIQSMRESADIFARVRLEYGALANEEKQIATLTQSVKSAAKDEDRSKTEKELKESQQRLSEVRERLQKGIQALADTKPPYTQLAGLYRGLLALKGGDINGARSELEKVRWSEVQDLNSNDRFFAELGALAIAKATLDDSATSTAALVALRELAERGSFVNVSAAYTLAILADNAESRAESLRVLDNLTREHPEHLDVLKDEIERLKS